MHRAIVTFGCLALMLLCSAPAGAREQTRVSYWPVHEYLASASVLGRYYQEFIAQYGRLYPGASEAFQGFCRRLRGSDLLADQFNRLGIPSRQVQAILHELEGTEFGTAERRAVQQNMLALDLALETIEGSITHNHRAEFRREVLAEIPPITSTG